MNPAIVSTCKAKIAHLVEAYPELGDDEDFRRDVLEGEADLVRVMTGLVREFRAKTAEAAGLADEGKKLAERGKARTEAAAKIKSTLFDLMDIGGFDRFPLPSANLSVQTVQPSVVVTDESAIPPAFVRTRTEPDKAMIRDALKAGQSVPGAQLSNGGRTLRIA